MASKFNIEMREAAELASQLEATMARLTKASKASGSRKDNIFVQYAEYIGRANTALESLNSDIQSMGKSGGDLKVLKELKSLADTVSARTKELNKLTNKNLDAIEKEKKAREALAKAEAKGTSRTIAKKQKALDQAVEERKLAEANLTSKKVQLELEEKQTEQVRERFKLFKKEMKILEDNLEGSLLFDPSIGFKSGDWDKTVQYMEGSLEEVADNFGKVVGGNIESVGDLVVSSVKKAGKILRSEGAKSKLEGGEGKLLGFDLGKIGKALGLLGGLAGGLMAVGKAMMAVEEAQKGVNKELIETYGATDVLVEGTGNVTEAVNEMREGLTSSSFANTLGVSLEQARQFATELNGIGINLRTMEGDLDGIKNLTMDLRASALSLGINFSDASGFAQNFREELGIAVDDGQLLKRMGQEFGRIRDLAAQSSFSTNRFFQVVQGLTENIGSMNVRVGEAGTLFLKLSKVLGPKAGQQFAQGLTEGFRSEGIQDRMKRIILTGRGAMTKAAARSGRSAFKELIRDRSVKSLLEEQGITSSAQLGKLSDRQIQDLMAELQNSGASGGARALLRTRDLARGGSGNMNDLVMALGEFDMSGTMASQMQQIMAFLGPKGFAGASAAQLEALTNYTGKSLEELMTYRKLDFDLQAKFRKAQVVKDRLDMTRAEKNTELAKLGLELNEENKLISKASGEIVSDIQDYTHTQGDEINGNQRTQLDQLELLQQVRDATLTASERMSNYLGGLMQKMISPLNYLADSKSGENRKELKKRATQLSDEIKNETSSIASQRDKDRQKIAEMQRKGARSSEVEALKKSQERALKKREAALEVKRRRAEYLMSYEAEQMMGDHDIDVVDRFADSEAREALARTSSGRSTLLTAGLKGGSGERMEILEKLSMARMRANTSNEDEKKEAQKEVAKYTKQLEKMGFKVEVTLEQGQKSQINEALKTKIKLSDKNTTSEYDASAVRHFSQGILDYTSKAQGALVDTELAEGRLEGQNKRLSEIKEALEAQDLSDADKKKLQKEEAEINAKMLAENKAYQEATGKTYEQAILSARKKELESTVKSYLGGNTSFEGMDRNKALTYISTLQKKVGAGEISQDQFDQIRAQFRQYYAFDSKMGPNDPTPYLFRRGTVTIGKPSDTAYLRDETVRGGGGGGGGMGGHSVVNINICGGDTHKVFETVKNAVSTANKMAMA